MFVDRLDLADVGVGGVELVEEVGRLRADAVPEVAREDVVVDRALAVVHGEVEREVGVDELGHHAPPFRSSAGGAGG